MSQLTATGVEPAAIVSLPLEGSDGPGVHDIWRDATMVTPQRTGRKLNFIKPRQQIPLPMQYHSPAIRPATSTTLAVTSSELGTLVHINTQLKEATQIT